MILYRHKERKKGLNGCNWFYNVYTTFYTWCNWLYNDN